MGACGSLIYLHSTLVYLCLPLRHPFCQYARHNPRFSIIAISPLFPINRGNHCPSTYLHLRQLFLFSELVVNNINVRIYLTQYVLARSFLLPISWPRHTTLSSPELGNIRHIVKECCWPFITRAGMGMQFTALAEAEKLV